MKTHRLGQEGEHIAEEYLRTLGYHIVARNFRFGRHGEIDVIAYDGDTLVFIEVKYRRSRTYGTPEEAVGQRKRYQLRRIAEGFLYAHPHPASAYRFDVIAIEQTKAETTIRHWKNAFW